MTVVFLALGDPPYAAALAQPSQSASWAISANKVSSATVVKGYRSGVTSALKVAVSNQTDWISLWKKHAAVNGSTAGPAESSTLGMKIVGQFYSAKKDRRFRHRNGWGGTQR